MNKKKLMTFGILGFFAVGLVVAGYYAIFSTTFTVLPAIVLSGNCVDTIEDVYEGSTVFGDECVLTNGAPTERNLLISNNAGSNIGVSYLGTLTLAKKTVAGDVWTATGDTITIDYTIIGDSFEVTGVDDGYTAIYYKDASIVLGDRLANPQPAIEIVSDMGNLPETDDANWDELADYCVSDGYDQCKGAKIWVVPNDDLDEGVLNWANMANYYYELDLIQYNAEGEITLSPGASLTITPVYEVGVGVIGLKTITTTIA